MFKLPEYEVIIHINENAFSESLVNEIKIIGKNYSLHRSTEYQGRRDYHWAFKSWSETVSAAEQFKHLIENPNLLILIASSSAENEEEIIYKNL